MILLKQPVRTYIGDTTNLPTGIEETQVKKSVQHWYGEYHLPNTVYVAPKGYDVLEYARTNNGLDGKESFWLKDGYILINFKIVTVKNKDVNNEILGYISPRCNMWEIEDYQTTKTDSYGNTFNFQ